MHLPHENFYTKLESKLKGTLFFKTEIITKTCRGLKDNLDLTIRKIFVNTFCKRVPKAREKLPRHGRTKNNCFFSTFNARGVCKNILFKKVLMQLSTSLMGNAFFLKMSIK